MVMKCCRSEVTYFANHLITWQLVSQVSAIAAVLLFRKDSSQKWQKCGYV